MKVYSDTLTVADLERCASNVAAPIYLNGQPTLVEGRKRRFEGVTLRARAELRMPGWRDGQMVAGYGVAAMGGRKLYPQFATYDEHGHWMARLFDIDPNARIVSAVNRFDGRADFHAQTGCRYDN